MSLLAGFRVSSSNHPPWLVFVWYKGFYTHSFEILLASLRSVIGVEVQMVELVFTHLIPDLVKCPFACIRCQINRTWNRLYVRFSLKLLKILGVALCH
jgi:hypothetical protein